MKLIVSFSGGMPPANADGIILMPNDVTITEA